MKKVLFAAALLLIGSAAHAASCDDMANDKKLSGAARNSFVQKCEREARGASPCAAKATEKKLSGAARNSFIQKCERDSAK